MIISSYGGNPIFVLCYQPDYGQSDVTGTVEKLTFSSSGMSQREERQPLATSLRWGISYTAYLAGFQAPTLASALNQWDNRNVVCPWWPGERLVSSNVTPSVTGGLTIFYEPNPSSSTGWGNWEITTGGNPIGFTPSPACKRAPLLWGRFNTWPQRSVQMPGDEELVTFDLVENGDTTTALDARTVTLTNGSSLNGQTPPVLTVPFEWDSSTFDLDVRIDRKKIGFGRDDADGYYPQSARNHVTLSFSVMNSAETAYLLYLFKAQAGSTNPLWLPAPDVGTGNIYVRFYSDKLSLTWSRSGQVDEIVAAQIEFITLPTEVAIPSGETFGTTIGPVSGPCWMYDIYDGTTHFYYTSYEGTLVGPGGNSFVHQSMTHGNISEELNLQQHDCSLDVQHWANGVFSRLYQNTSAAPLTVTIYEGVVSAPGAAVAIFTGVAQAPKIVGQKLQISLKGRGDSILATMGPKSIVQIGCNAVLGDTRCRVNLATFQYTRTLVSVVGPIATLSPGAGLPPVGYFQNGCATRVASGITQQFLINDNYTTAGNITLVLVGSCVGSSAGESWVLTPACDGKYATCIGRFSNGINHRGSPNMPDKNPSMYVVNTTKGSKK